MDDDHSDDDNRDQDIPVEAVIDRVRQVARRGGNGHHRLANFRDIIREIQEEQPHFGEIRFSCRCYGFRLLFFMLVMVILLQMFSIWKMEQLGKRPCRPQLS